VGSAHASRVRRTRTLAVSLVTGLSLVLAACGGGGDEAGGRAADVPESQRQLYEAAVAAGGTANLFIGTGIDEQTDQLIELFNETFPDVAVEYVSGTGNEVTERLLTEKRAGLNNVDVLLVAGMSAFRRVAGEGFMEPFTPEDARLFTQDPATYVDGVAYSFSNIYHAACFNPANVTEQEARLLESYEGWADPTWRGRAAIVNAAGFGYRFGLTHWVYQDPGLGRAWLERLAALDTVVYNSATDVVPQVIAGEYDVVFNAMMQYGAQAHRDGAPLRCTTGEYAPYYTFGAGLVKDAPNSAAGRLFVDWLFSEAGQLAVQETWSFDARREGIDTPVVDAGWWDIPADTRHTDEGLVDESYADLVATFDAAFDGQE
jgi:ABC-type Fe3+ transport system substrate-binding protein